MCHVPSARGRRARYFFRRCHKATWRPHPLDMRPLLIYPLVRLSRATTTAVCVHQTFGSNELAALAFCLCDLSSIVADARPLLTTWSQFWIAALFLPWMYEAYWAQFAAHPRFDRYKYELAGFVLLACLVA